jgi:tRNA pseudouridine55 synthase
MPTSATETRPAVLDAVVNVRKEAGWTSHDVVAKLRGCLKGMRIGHAGTLDPSAVGVLPLLLGRATRIAEYLMDWDKEYVGVLRLGETTDTLDGTGTVLVRRATEHLTEDAIRSTIERFQGRLLQVPPMYSAVKVAGVPLYKSARAGRTVHRKPREVHVHTIDFLTIKGRDVTLRVTCSKGTYIRTLCGDIGEALGVGAHLAALERTRVGPLTIDRALPVMELCQWLLHGDRPEGTEPHLISLDQALADLPALTVTAEAAARVMHGGPVPGTAVLWDRSIGGERLLSQQTVRLKDPEGRLLGVGTLPAGDSRSQVLDGTIRTTKVLINI